MWLQPPLHSSGLPSLTLLLGAREGTLLVATPDLRLSDSPWVLFNYSVTVKRFLWLWLFLASQLVYIAYLLSSFTYLYRLTFPLLRALGDCIAPNLGLSHWMDQTELVRMYCTVGSKHSTWLF